MQVRYRYRLYPAPGQQQALARVFGCARVVYDDSLRLRDACHAAREKISDTEVQRRVITAKLTPERSWLGEVASVALVQACQDARRTYRNSFDSLKGHRKVPAIRHPKPRRKHGRQSIRLTRNGFSLRGRKQSKRLCSRRETTPPWPALKQEPTGARREPRWRNPAVHGGEDVNTTAKGQP
jgi:putative transposase